MTETKEMPDWLINPQPIKSENIDVAQIAKMDTAILKANLYFQKKYWLPKMVEFPLKNGKVVQTSSMPPMELFWTPSRHKSHESIGYAIVWGYDVRYLHPNSTVYPSPMVANTAYSLYHGPISLFLSRFSENTEELDKWEKHVLSVEEKLMTHADYRQILKSASQPHTEIR